MRKESKIIATAFMFGRKAAMARTMTDGQAVFLHGNKIAWREDDGTIKMTLAGWPTVTTRERLNAICVTFGKNCRFGQRKHNQYYGDTEISAFDVVTLEA